MLRTVVVENPDYVGAWVVYLPNALDGNDAAFVNTAASVTGRFESYYTNDHGKVELVPLTHYEESDYYTIPLNTGQEAVAEPYYQNIGGEDLMITSVCIPIKRNGQTIGVAGIDILLTEVQKTVGEIKPFGVGYAGLYSPSGVVLASSNAAKIGKFLKDVSVDMYGEHMDTLLKALAEGKVFDKTIYSKEDGANILTVTSPFTLGGDKRAWSAVSIVRESVILAPVYTMTTVLIILGVVILIAITVVIIFISNSITAPLKVMEGVFGYIGKGDFTHTIESKSNDEIGNITRALNVTVGNIKELVSTIKKSICRAF